MSLKHGYALLIAFGIGLLFFNFQGPNERQSFDSNIDSHSIKSDVLIAMSQQYTRIRVHTKEDIEKLYSLILEYIQHPELADSVKEFVFRLTEPREMYLRKTDRPAELKTIEQNRDISNEPEISQAVECLDLGEEKSNWVRILTWMKPELLAMRKAETITMDISPYYNKRTKEFGHHASALLLMLCPNIESLVYEDGSQIIENVLRRNNYGKLPAHHLQKLRQVEFLPTTETILGDDRFYTHFDILKNLQMVHRLPSVDRISVDGVGPNDDGGYLTEFPAATSDLKKIHVGHAIYGTNVISPLIRIPTALEEFSWSTGGRNNLDGGYNSRYPKTIGKSLLCHKSTLRVIDIDIDEYISETESPDGDEEDIDPYYKENPFDLAHDLDEWWEMDKLISHGPSLAIHLPNTRPYGNTIGSLHDFENLKSLSIGIQLLLGTKSWKTGTVPEAPFRLIDGLPKSLESLIIRGYEKGEDAHWDDQIEELRLKKDELLPSLREISGIEETIPSAMSIDDPDDNEDLLWQPEELDDDWK